MPPRQARPGQHPKDRLPGAVTTHASPPLLSQGEVWALVVFLGCVTLCIAALEGWASRPAPGSVRPVAGTHPLLAPRPAPQDPLDLTGLLPGDP